jgi:hypothetical protein
MKKSILILILTMACIHPFNWHKRIFPRWHGVAVAAPFLVCDPHPLQADSSLYFTVSGLPTNIDATHIAKEPVGSQYGFKFDIGQVPVGGPYTVKAKACNAWGCSADSLPLEFSRAVPLVAPVNARLSQ